MAFAGGTISATGGNGGGDGTNSGDNSVAGVANSGQGAYHQGALNTNDQNFATIAGNGAYVVAGGAVTPGVGITVTVGAGGTAGGTGAAGGSGYVWIEYQV